jgi:cytochrome c-type biogenesis protein CcmH
MTWLLAIAAGLAAFALAVILFRIERALWTTLAAALALGLAGYALQASPEIAGAPARPTASPGEAGWALIDERKAMVAGARRSRSDKLIVADAMTRQGQYANATALLRGATADNPRDGEAWLALGNALVEHTGGVLTKPALLAYRRAAETDPAGVGPGYFLGMAMIRQGQLMQARGIWVSTLETAAEDATGREVLAERLGRLDEIIAAGGRAPVPQ